MGNENVYDFFTGKTLTEIADDRRMDPEKLRKEGKYAGVLTYRRTVAMRALIQDINLKHHQMKALRREFDALWALMYEEIEEALEELRVKPGVFDAEKDDFHVTEDGHVYLVFHS